MTAHKATKATPKKEKADGSENLREPEIRERCGVWRYGKNIGAKGRGGQRPIEETIAVEVPAIVSREVWQAAHARSIYNQCMSPRNNRRYQYMLRGMVKCGCGRAMVGQRTGYQCSSVTNRYRGIEARTCFEKRAHGGTLEAIAWDYALSIITDPDGLEQKLRQAQAAELTALQPKRDELDQVNNEIAQVETDAAKIAQALEDMLPEQRRGIVGKSMLERAGAIDERYHKLIIRRDVVQAELDKRVITDDEIADMVCFSSDVALGLSDPTWEDKRHWLELLRTKVEVKDGTAWVTCMLRKGATPFALNTSRSLPIRHLRK